MYKHFFIKFFDFCIALVALIVLSPVLLVVSFCLFIVNVKGSPSFEGGACGWLLFPQERPGKDAKIFKVIKFMTMSDELMPRQFVTRCKRLTRA